MKKLGLLSVTGLTMLLGLVNVNTARRAEAPKAQTLEVKDVLVKGATEGEGRVVRRAAAPATEYGMSDTFLQVTAPDADGTVDVRFVAGIDSYAYTEAKFGVEMFAGAEYKGSIEKAVTTAYAAMEIDGEVKTASEVFGEGYNYLIAYTMKDMPEDSWKNGFRATVGLKAEGDEEFTEQETQEVKVVKSAIMADNHLLFTWTPWSDVKANATMKWENDFFADAVAPEIVREDYEKESAYTNAINAAIKANMRAEVIIDGVVYKCNNVAQHGVLANKAKQVVVAFANLGVDLTAQPYEIRVYINLADGREIVGTRSFTRLSEVENAVVTQDGTDYVLTFDNVPNATSYTYKIFNSEYESDEMKVVSGAKLATTTLSEGTYSISITAKSNEHAPSTKVFADAFVVENTIQIVEGTDKFEFEFYHTGGAWEGLFRFRPIDEADAVTVENAISDMKVVRESEKLNFKFISYAVNGINANKENPYYDANTGWYTVGYSIGEAPSKNNIYTFTFVVSTDAGNYYSINLKYLGEKDLAVCGTTLSEIYAKCTTFEFASFDREFYSETSWNLLEGYYNAAMDAFATATDDTAKSIYENALANMKTVVADIVTLSFVSAEAPSGDARAAIDKNDGTRWESAHQNDGIYIIFNFDTLSYINKLEIKWEGANAKDFDILVTTDGGVTWTPIMEMRNCGGGNRVDTIKFETPVAATAIKIDCINRNLEYGYSIFEIYAWGSK